MAEQSRSPVPPATTITDLNEDCIAHCAGHLSLGDVCNLAMASSALKRLAYSDSIWQRFFRLFPLNEMTSVFRGDTQGEKNVLVTSSCDHSIRLWWKGSSLRCFRGHNGPVLSLSNKLLGEDGRKVLASGGEDGTVRLWSLGSSGKRGQLALKATLYGHEKPVNLMSVAGHKTSLLVSISRDSKVSVWDTGAATSSAVRTSCCVGMASVPGTPVNMKCHESLLYVAAGSSATAFDLRTMQKVITAAVHQPKLCSFDAIPSKYLIRTGGDGRAMLWDVRRNQESLKPEPIAELDGHCGQVTLLHMDPYKIVTGGPDNAYVNVWEVDTGVQTNSLLCSLTDGAGSGCDAMAVDGCRITTTSYSEDSGVLCFRDYNHDATNPVTKLENEPSSKFWISMSDDDSDD
ncbi:TAF5-like RNA polymerase II p300/CBP-associated factor-associated factor 65 kDa subunit 5L [Glycine soja]|nr:TAF5-like RNA polymerase II p300/CBP-associated factor-associated factor 65 kDa subunit 5L [Glycine soja]